MFSQSAEYALRAVVWLASHREMPLTNQQVARATQVPPSYLAKVLQALSRAGLVHAQRGPHGGFTLSRPPAELTLLDVVNAVDPVRRIQVCPLARRKHRKELCSLHACMDEAISLAEAHLARATVDTLIEGGGRQPLDAVHVDGDSAPRQVAIRGEG
ncbi:MAG: RrF2 family transcriptional regulator [Phycisphaeraceae bacterium]